MIKGHKSPIIFTLFKFPLRTFNKGSITHYIITFPCIFYMPFLCETLYVFNNLTLMRLEFLKISYHRITKFKARQK